MAETQLDEIVFNDAIECQLLRTELSEARELLDAVLAETKGWDSTMRKRILLRRIQIFLTGEAQL